MNEIPITSTWITSAPPTKPEQCNICGGKVIFTSNARIYGRVYGNGMCYLCTNCGAYVGTHDTGDALGILSDKPLKNLKIMAHHKFDEAWKNKKIYRDKEYKKLAKVLMIPIKLCHFGYFNRDLLNAAIVAMESPNWFSSDDSINEAKQRVINKFGSTTAPKLPEKDATQTELF